ncbi:unnamed protein product [Rhizophagus irregularis]|nr:unnamed protein product [Rhizophagus irregularis]
MNIYPNELVIFICMLKDQAKLIHQLRSIQIDLTFKKVKKNINEFEINLYNTEHILSYACVYINVTTVEGYQQLFTDLFNVIKNLTGQVVKFRHIDKNGIGCIIKDLDPAQAKGLGLFLQSKDTHQDWKTHLQYIFKSCVIHFERNVRAKKFSSETLNLILNIPTAPSIGELKKIFYTLEQLEESKIKEAAHALANQEEKHLKLLTAIIRGRKVNQKTLKIMETKNKFGVPYSRRDNGEVKKISKAITHKGTRNEERKIILKEHELQICVQEVAARKALAEAEAIELINLEKKKSLELL